jgi:uncharacterized protein YukE
MHDDQRFTDHYQQLLNALELAGKEVEHTKKWFQEQDRQH